MDGELILNIADDNNVSTSKSSAFKKGGRWTERLKAKRTTQRKRQRPNGGQSQPESEAASYPAKRQKIEKDISTNDTPTGRSSILGRPKYVISSLFSSNPQLPVPSQDSRQKKPLGPSNAPVDTSTFEGLALSPLMISHLATKMSITRPTAIQRAALPTLFQENDARDAFIQSQTGSGKTLSYLLPIIQDLLPLSSLSYIDRSIGTLAIVIAPTRELAKQISDVAELLLTMRLRLTSDNGEENNDSFSSQRLTRWLVCGLLTGGATRTHEKARLRKGISILVSTPGRLLDHLQNTASFNVGKCRWLVLDEADRLMDLGFEDTIRDILKGLDGRRKLAMHGETEGNTIEVRGWDWKERRNILCSATIRDDVQKLAGFALRDPIVIKAFAGSSEATSGFLMQQDTATEEHFTPPSQLSQKYTIVPLKLRIVTLVALLRSLLSSHRGRDGIKIIVFFSCTDSVDFHWQLLAGATMDSYATSDADSEIDDSSSKIVGTEKIFVRSSLLPKTSIYRLHGSLPLKTRLASLKNFSAAKSKLLSQDSDIRSSILLCTSVASRGLDLPLVRAVIQYDLPTEGGANEYVHRVGRTARVGRGGEAWAIVAPSEEKWVPWVHERISNVSDRENIQLHAISVESILGHGFGGEGKGYEMRATQVQLAFERWVLQASTHADLAKKAFLSHIRAYATHPLDEKHIFHVRNLHLGHLAKSFALRETPSAVTNKFGKNSLKERNPRSKKRADKSEGHDVEETERRMIAAVRTQGRLSRKDGSMVTSGVSEFQIASSTVLEKLNMTE